MTNADELIRLSARTAVAKLKSGEISAHELIDAAEARMNAVEGAVNALPTRCLERARAHAGRLSQDDPNAGHPGWLAGLPIAIKDLTDVAGVRTTYGSPAFADHVPDASAPLVERLEERGGIVVAKSNTPEFGGLPVTMNPVFGATANPWNTGVTCGGSSGGAAAALAAGEVWLAHGSDIGGSLRIPAAFTGTVGLRPSFGRVPRTPDNRAFSPMAVEGPMARDVGDLALFLDAMAGWYGGDPLTLEAPAQSYQASVDAPVAPKRIAFSADLGFARIEKEVAEICSAAAARFAEIGASVDEATPDFTGVGRIFATMMQVSLTLNKQDLVDEKADLLDEGLVAAVGRGRKLSADRIYEAERGRAALFQRMARFFEDYDFLVTPAINVSPFDITKRGVTEIDGQPLDHLYDWITLASAIVLTSCPALVIPCGITKSGLPVGLQIVGKPRDEAGLLMAGALMEPIFGLSDRVPLDPIAG